LINADATYDINAIRNYNNRRGIKTNIPLNKRNRKGRMIGRHRKFDKEVYKKTLSEYSLAGLRLIKRSLLGMRDQRYLT
jgi:hypothetical protein